MARTLIYGTFNEKMSRFLGGALMSLTDEELLEKIADLKRQISDAINERRQLVSEIRRIRQKKNEKLERLRSVRQQIAQVREELKQRLNELKELKQRKSELLELVRRIRTELEEAKKLQAKSGDVDVASLERKIRALEWKLQTSTLNLDEEKKLILRIVALEKKLTLIKKREGIKERRIENKAELLARRVELNQLRERLQALVNEVTEKRKIYLSLKEERDNLFKEIGDLKKKIEDLKAKIEEVSKRIQELKSQRDALVNELKKVQEQERTNKEKLILEQKRKEVETKLKQGARLSFEDLLILYGEGKGENGEEQTGEDGRNIR
ncbi:MAG: hypothetical protein NO126_00315 [Sulfolobales archaeon]|nr:hypothetical protein [Sulfolobales archaeon]